MAQVQYEGIGTLLIDSVDVDVDMNEETGISETTIGTSALGPCLCFMIEFKYYDSSSNSTSQRCFVEHYTYWIDDVNKSSSKILNELLACLSTKLKLELDIISFYLTNTQRPLISDCRLVLAGGDINKTKDIHKAFSLLNSININKEAIIGEDRNLDVISLLNELLNRVIIFKSTYKGSVGESKRINTVFFCSKLFL